jgi:hypothetical protein
LALLSHLPFTEQAKTGYEYKVREVAREKKKRRREKREKKGGEIPKSCHFAKSSC